MERMCVSPEGGTLRDQGNWDAAPREKPAGGRECVVSV